VTAGGRPRSRLRSAVAAERGQPETSYRRERASRLRPLQTVAVDAEEEPTPRPGLTLAPEYSADLPVWHGPDGENIGNVGVEELVALGVSWRLIERLRAWQAGWDHDPFTSSPPAKYELGSPLTVRLAQDLQWELPEYRIFLATEAGPRPADEWPD
jgi:hypothetical protein